MTFRGCFKEVATKSQDGFLTVLGGAFLLLPAPNRYRKMGDAVDGAVFSWSQKNWHHDAIVARQLSEFPDIPNPVGVEHDLFDVYLAWEVGQS